MPPAIERTSFAVADLPALAREAANGAAGPLVGLWLERASATTRRAYGRDLRDFAGFVGVADITAAAAKLLESGHGPAHALALAYREHLVGRGLAPATVNRRLAALRSLVQLARQVGAVAWDLLLPRLPSRPYRDTAGPGVEAVRAMVRAAGEREGPAAARDQALLALLADLALRRGEVIALDLADLDVIRCRLSIIGKGEREPTLLTLPSATADTLRAWVAVRGEWPGPLIVGIDRHGKIARTRLTGSGLYHIVRTLGGNVGAPATRPHGLRHTSITAVAAASAGDLRLVQAHGRHKSLTSTRHYLDAVEDLSGQAAQLAAGVLRGHTGTAAGENIGTNGGELGQIIRGQSGT